MHLQTHNFKGKEYLLKRAQRAGLSSSGTRFITGTIQTFFKDTFKIGIFHLLSRVKRVRQGSIFYNHSPKPLYVTSTFSWFSTNAIKGRASCILMYKQKPNNCFNNQHLLRQHRPARRVSHHASCIAAGPHRPQLRTGSSLHEHSMDRIRND